MGGDTGEGSVHMHRALSASRPQVGDALSLQLPTSPVFARPKTQGAGKYSESRETLVAGALVRARKALCTE